jgi:LacI family gluconate utilization system Gnt-I transcriptional repressor
MARNPTMKDVAKEAHVSVMTVSRAFKRHSSVSKETRERILLIAEKMGYVFDSVAANLRSQKSSFVAVTVPTINNSNFAETVDALSSEIAMAGMQVLLGYDRYEVEQEELLIEQLLRRRPDAVVVTGGRHTQRGRRLLQSAGVPVIETWDLPERPINHVVGFSNSKCMTMMVDHLIERGRRRIAFIGGDFSDDTRGADRRRGFIAALNERGLEPADLIPLGGPSTVQNGADAMARLLESGKKFDAVVSVFDNAAFGALTECQRQGIKVPDDIALAGFGATDIASVTCPALTTIDPHCAEIGRRAGALITDLLKNPGRQVAPVCVEIRPVLKIGESTGGKVAAKPLISR